MRFLFIDTCTWLKLEFLEQKNLFKTAILFSFASIAITHEIKREIDHYSISNVDFKQIFIYPITDQKLYRHALEAGFDDADASLLSNGRIAVDELYLISEDRPFITFSQMYNMPVMQLVDLFRILATLNYIDKTDFYNLIKFLRDHRNITQKKEKKLLAWLKILK